MLLEVRAEHRGAGLAAALGLPACRDGLAQLREAVGHALPVRVGILTILPDCTSSRFSAAEFSKSYAGSLGLLGSYLAHVKLCPCQSTVQIIINHVTKLPHTRTGAADTAGHRHNELCDTTYK
jgi:hypothetical protein